MNKWLKEGREAGTEEGMKIEKMDRKNKKGRAIFHLFFFFEKLYVKVLSKF